MKPLFIALLLSTQIFSTTISVVPIHEPISLHGTDVDDIITDTGEALQATVISRPMALSGAFPEALIEAIQTPHPIPTNTDNYKVTEANLLVLCHVSVSADSSDEGLKIKIDVAQLKIPEEADITGRQLLKLTLVAIQRTLEIYNSSQLEPLNVFVEITGTTEKNETLKDLGVAFVVPPAI